MTNITQTQHAKATASFTVTLHELVRVKVTQTEGIAVIRTLYFPRCNYFSNVVVHWLMLQGRGQLKHVDGHVCDSPNPDLGHSRTTFVAPVQRLFWWRY